MGDGELKVGSRGKGGAGDLVQGRARRRPAAEKGASKKMVPSGRRKRLQEH